VVQTEPGVVPMPLVDLRRGDAGRAFDDQPSWRPVEQIAAELEARGIDPDRPGGGLNAELLARRLMDS
jgi:hypothetical protein